MKVVGNLLDRFRHLEPPERVVKNAVIQAVKDIMRVELNSEDIKVNNKGILFLNTQSGIKSAVFEVKSSVIARINNLLLNSSIKDIK